MPALASRSRGGRSRRMVNDINVVPYIDVMLVLLVIFMVTAPLVPPGAIDLPRAGRSTAKTDKYIEVQVFADGTMRLRTGNTGDPSERRVARADLEGSVRALLAEHGEAMPVVISGDRAVRYERVIEVLGDLQQMNIARVALMVKPGN
ncbi:biopolymer transporter ExbD [Zeimonas arvi]|uniref:Protein TolR n=1 Tax=Zeimonas arvi TaxID=2498847 RepID=A0A5C8P4R7_9BURK|nr:biopolymer transporter ExbD [Zeimonas arvi]TXL68510.1 protein TolR [Zeimonas arvi]